MVIVTDWELRENQCHRLETKHVTQMDLIPCARAFIYYVCKVKPTYIQYIYKVYILASVSFAHGIKHVSSERRGF